GYRASISSTVCTARTQSPTHRKTVWREEASCSHWPLSPNRPFCFLPMDVLSTVLLEHSFDELGVGAGVGVYRQQDAFVFLNAFLLPAHAHFRVACTVAPAQQASTPAPCSCSGQCRSQRASEHDADARTHDRGCRGC